MARVPKNKLTIRPLENGRYHLFGYLDQPDRTRKKIRLWFRDMAAAEAKQIELLAGVANVEPSGAHLRGTEATTLDLRRRIKYPAMKFADKVTWSLCEYVERLIESDLVRRNEMRPFV